MVRRMKCTKCSLFENVQEPPHSAAATTLLRLSPTVRGDTLNIISVMELLSAPRANESSTGGSSII